MKAMETVQDLIEEAKARTVWWALCVFAIAYFLTHTSKSMWMNIPISILFISALRILANEMDLRWKIPKEVRPQTYLSYLEKKQLSMNDPYLIPTPPMQKWKRKVDSPLVEDAINEFVNKIVQDFVIDLWYTEITPDKETPELIGEVITDAIGEISGRLKQLNLVELLTRDVVNLIGDHLDLFRRNQAAIGINVMETLSMEQRDERLKQHLMGSKELHPALISPECEYQFLQRLIGGVLAVVLRPLEAQCPMVRCIARELVTCLVMQPVMDFVSPAYINELIEYILLAANDTDSSKTADCHVDRSVTPAGVLDDFSTTHASPNNSENVTTLTIFENKKEMSIRSGTLHDDPMKAQPPDWARMLDNVTQRRTEILAPENLENMWTKGSNYKKKVNKKSKLGFKEPVEKGLNSDSLVPVRDLTRELLKIQLSPNTQTHIIDKQLIEEGKFSAEIDSGARASIMNENSNGLKRSNSTSALKVEPNAKEAFSGVGGASVLSADFYSANFVRHNVEDGERLHVAKLRCRVKGAYFEKVGSKSFAVYLIEVTDTENTIWSVRRRYTNFERLHRKLKDIPNYTLHLPPKKIFSSNMDDAFVLKRCFKLDKYLQDLLSLANVAEQHEVWDFLSASSKNYSFGRSSSVIKTLAVNVDDAMDDIVRQVKGVSDGLMRKVVGSSSLPSEAFSSISGKTLSWHPNESSSHMSRQSTAESANCLSDSDEDEKDESHGQNKELDSSAHGSHSDNVLNSKDSQQTIKRSEDSNDLVSEAKHGPEVKFDRIGPDDSHVSRFLTTSSGMENPIGMPPEWRPSNVSVPILNLVDKIFQLNRRGWLRRQVFWMSKQIVQLMMEDAIDDWILRQIHWLRRDDIIAEGIQLVQEVLWPDGTFFLPLRTTQGEINDTQRDRIANLAGSKPSKADSFEQQKEAARRASDIEKLLFEGAPTALVSLIGHKQYNRCAKDVYYFSQSNICVKQLGYGVLELALISVFPELRDLVLDAHKQMRGKAV